MNFPPTSVIHTNIRIKYMYLMFHEKEIFFHNNVTVLAIFSMNEP